MIRAVVCLSGLFAICGADPPLPARADPAAAPPQAPGEIWRVQKSGCGSPISDGSSVYFLTREHELVAVSAATGEVSWTRRVGEPTTATSGCNLVVSGPLIIVGDYDVSAFDRSTGELRWQFRPADGYGPGIYLGSVSGGFIVAGSPAARVYALDASTGRLRWSTVFSDDGRTTVFPPVIVGGEIYASYTTFTAPPTGGVVAWSLTSGEEIWRRRFPDAGDSAVGSTAAAGGPIGAGKLIIAADVVGRIHGFDSRTGTIRWSIPRLHGTGRRAEYWESGEFRAMAAGGGTLFAASLHGIVTAYDLRTQEERWRYYDVANGSAGFQIGIADGRLFVPFVSAGLVELRASDGKELWRVGTGVAEVAWPPSVLASRLYITSGAGLLAFED
jgi:outer membrane protein assembly factor BamB